MYNTKKESRPAGTETAILVKEVFGNPRKDYITKFSTIQVVIAFFSAIALVLLTAWAIIDICSTNTAEFVPVEHKVKPGETLWNIAEEYKPDDISMDRYMAWVYEHNDYDVIYPGDTVIMAEVIK